VVITSGRPTDLEPIVAVDRFLTALGARNPRFLLLDWDPDRPRWTPLDAHLASGVQRLADGGGLGYRAWRRLDLGAPCFGIGLGRPPRPACRTLGTF
jgi:hypothetical protein